MTLMRSLSRIDTAPPPAPGFIGEGHTAVEVVGRGELADRDPFVFLMDDRLDMRKRRVIGGPHPHAGIETVTFILEGTLHDRDEGDLREGDVVWMTAGRGIIHNEAVEAEGRSRVLQLWIALPARDRAIAPRFQVLRRDEAPVFDGPGVRGRVYSGALGSARAPTSNRVPVTMVDLTFEPAAVFRQELAATYNGFFYVLDGSVRVGDDVVKAGQIGWLAPAASADLAIAAGEGGARLVLYAGEPIAEPLVHHGPFVAGSRVEIAELYRSFRDGAFTSMHALARRRDQNDEQDDDQNTEGRQTWLSP
jgi:redox-sensitive bicupin YhaK (pirin superfamily)